MKLLLSGLVFSLLSTTTAWATSPCPPNDWLFEQATLVAHGTFDRILQKKPILRCADAEEAKIAGNSQCQTTIQEKSFNSDPYRLKFRIERILKINLKEMGDDAFKVQNKGESTPHIQLPAVIVEADKALDGQTGFVFLSGKNAFNDLLILECGFIANTESADRVKTLSDKWPTAIIVE